MPRQSSAQRGQARRPSGAKRAPAPRRTRQGASKRTQVWWQQPKPVTHAVRYPRLAAAAFLGVVTVATLAVTLGILWIFVPEVADRTLQQAARAGAQVVDFVESVLTVLLPAS